MIVTRELISPARIWCGPEHGAVPVIELWFEYGAPRCDVFRYRPDKPGDRFGVTCDRVIWGGVGRRHGALPDEAHPLFVAVLRYGEPVGPLLDLLVEAAPPEVAGRLDAAVRAAMATLV